MEELWLYQQENNYDAIFLQETDYIEGKPLGHFKHWKNRMFTNCKNKIQVFGVGTLVSQQQKNVFRDDLSGPDLELPWNEMQIIKRNTKIGKLLEDIINRHNLFIATDVDFTYQQSASINNNGKSTIELTLTRGLANVKITTKDFDKYQA